MAVDIPFQKHLDFEYGQVDQLSPLVRRVIAENPGPFTFYGTGTYIVGRGQVAVADWNFQPDVLIADDETVAKEDWSLTGVFTPGHAANHMGFYLPQERALFCGDAVMGWSTTIVSPPDGNMVAYMHTLDRLLARDDDISMLPVVYSELDSSMYPAAQRSLMATIECLVAKEQLVIRSVNSEEQFFLISG